MFEKRRQEIHARRAEIRGLLATASAEDLAKYETELDQLDVEERTLDQREGLMQRMNRGGQTGGHGDRGDGEDGDGGPETRGLSSGPVNPISSRGGAFGQTAGGGLPHGTDSRAAWLAEMQGIRPEDAEARAKQFAGTGRMEIPTGVVQRSLTLATGEIAQPTRVSGISAGQNIVSGIVDLVRVVDANGMGEDSVAYEVSGGQTAAIKKDDGTAQRPPRARQI